MKPKQVGILFSAGLDSTYLTYKTLKEGHCVYPLYVNIENNGYKPDLEKRQAKLLIDEFRNEFGYGRVETLREIISIKIDSGRNSVGYSQIPIWLMGVLYHGMEISEVRIGYVCKDSAVSFIDDIKRAYRWLSEAAYVKHKPVLKFPIIKLDKTEIIDLLPRQYKELVTTCEMPIFENDTFYACGECITCNAAKNIFGRYHKNELKTIFNFKQTITKSDLEKSFYNVKESDTLLGLEESNPNELDLALESNNAI